MNKLSNIVPAQITQGAIGSLIDRVAGSKKKKLTKIAETNAEVGDHLVDVIVRQRG